MPYTALTQDATSELTRREIIPKQRVVPNSSLAMTALLQTVTVLSSRKTGDSMLSQEVNDGIYTVNRVAN